MSADLRTLPDTLANDDGIVSVHSDAEMYAEMFRNDPARAFGIMASQLARLDALLDQLEPLVNDPSRLLAGVPAPLRTMLGL